MPIQTRVTKLLGIEHPIVMGGMTGVGTVELAAAVSNAGGLGIFAAHNAGSPEGCRQWIRRIRTLTNKPFGVNLTILPTLGPPPPYQEYAQVCVDENVPIIETAGSNPKPFIRFFQAAGIITIHKCVTIRHALSAERMGVDIISLDGFECAGHPGEGDVGNYVLQAKGALVLKKTPFICSGGVGDGKQIAAAFALGAEGVNCGTRFCATQECLWPESFKERMLHATEEDTVLMFRHLKNTTRVFANKVAKEVEDIELQKGANVKFQDLAHLVAGKRGRAAEQAGDADGGIWTAGQVIGLIDDIPTVAQLMQRMMAECEDTIRGRLNSMLAVPSRL
ncbi:Nitronate monooxygenase [Seminavis robusta]|uniref:Nitronate monooxygenase n=1 Tax=Seminavis robusta TaxID=568900 RepID=A0A9N8HMT8_9STRA|nr:Nitronate monooxygenase [Seminavis robusta]|eukprot:Sro931_g221500.1 Nitronate monooxygenase (335) ;mRNA; r:35417-36421